MLKVCGHNYNEAAIELTAAVFFFFFQRLQEHGHEFLDETKLLAKENSARFLLVFILIHGKDKHDRLLVQIVLNGLREPTVRVRSCKCHMFLNCLCSSIFLKITEFTFPFYRRTAYNGVVYQ